MHEHYALFKFPPYQFREYPKWITPAGSKKQVLAQTAEEEARLLGKPVPPTPVKKEEPAPQIEILAEPVADPEPVDTTEDEKSFLLDCAKKWGINANKSWGIPKLKAAIEKAEADNAAA